MTHRTFDEQIANFNRVVSSWDINQEYKVALLGMIASLGYEHEKSITPEPHWIPVTERLPEKDGEYLTTWIDAQKKLCVNVFLVENGVWYWNQKYLFPNWRIIAWMPLPEPFNEVTE